THRSVFFIDAKDEYEKSGTRNTLTEENIEKIYKTYIERKDVDKFAHLASFEEIEENGFNLNIPRYVDTFEEEEDIPLDKIGKDLASSKKEIEETKADIIEDLKGLVGTNEESQKDLEAFLKILGDNND
ncbi:MAG: N-6 DNA methylase, partial [Peptoniphilaceae bacterium]|nr:N-6 DNA methylase [Peptoniphilaceae bacterium]